MRITESIASSRMSGLQIRAVVLAIALIIIDGYDIALMSFTAPYVRAEFNISAVMLGLILSGALVGMFVGSVFVAPIADRIGRRKAAIIATTIVAIGMSIGPLAQDPLTLFISRVITGLGVGILVAVVGVILSEYTSKRAYAIVMAIYAAGINIGSVLGALIVGPLVPEQGWRFAFLVGAILGVIALAATVLLFPESITWLAEGRRKGSLERLNSLLARMNHPPLEKLPTPEAPGVAAKGSVRTVFSKGLGWQTILMIVAYVLYMVVFYFMTNWAPTSVANANENPALAAPMTLSFSLGGLIGTIIFGLVATKVNPRILTPIFLVTGAIGLAWFGLSGTSLPDAFVAVFIASFFVSAGTAGFYSIVPLLYPTLARATGYGIVIGAGRLGGIAAPLLGGMAFDAGLSVAAAFSTFAVPLLFSAACILVLHLGLKAKDAKPDPGRTDSQPSPKQQSTGTSSVSP